MASEREDAWAREPTRCAGRRAQRPVEAMAFVVAFGWVEDSMICTIAGHSEGDIVPTQAILHVKEGASWQRSQRSRPSTCRPLRTGKRSRKARGGASDRPACLSRGVIITPVCVQATDLPATPESRKSFSRSCAGTRRGLARRSCSCRISPQTFPAFHNRDGWQDTSPL